MQTIAPGTKVTLKLVKQPTNQAAAKTIVRLMNKDKAAKAESLRQAKIRAKGIYWEPRGGRLWATRIVKQPSVELTLGVSKTIVASLDVLTDLKSVSRFLEVTPA